MGTKEKLIERFKTQPKDFTFEEAIRLFGFFGYHQHNKGATSGSRIRFFNAEKRSFYNMHKPHSGSIMKPGALKSIYDFLKSQGLI